MNTTSSEELYWHDTYTWAMQQAEALRRRNFAAIDWENLIEEVEDIGRCERRTWTSHCKNLVEHMLKLEWRDPGEPETGPRWIDTVHNARISMRETIEDNPGLLSQRPEMLGRAWVRGRNTAVVGLATYEVGATVGSDFRNACCRWEKQLPAECPYTVEQIEDLYWWPEGISRKFEPREKDGGRDDRIGD